MSTLNLIELVVCLVCGYLAFLSFKKGKPNWLLAGVSVFSLLLVWSAIYRLFAVLFNVIIFIALIAAAYYLYSVYQKKGIDGAESTVKQWVDKGVKAAKAAKEKYIDR